MHALTWKVEAERFDFGASLGYIIRKPRAGDIAH
jgi:hypothetical protein